MKRVVDNIFFYHEHNIKYKYLNWILLSVIYNFCNIYMEDLSTHFMEEELAGTRPQAQAGISSFIIHDI